MLTRAVAELTAQRAEEAQAAASPDRPRRHPNPQRRGRHRGDTILTVVKAALVALLGVGAVLALMAPRHLQEQQYTPRSIVHIAHTHNDHDADDR
jgi:hypothetical protein